MHKDETFIPQEDSTPDYTDMISGVLALTDKQLEDLRQHIDITMTERKHRRKNELFTKFCKAYREFRTEFPDETHYIKVENHYGDCFELDILEEFDHCVGKEW